LGVILTKTATSKFTHYMHHRANYKISQ